MDSKTLIINLATSLFSFVYSPLFIIIAIGTVVFLNLKEIKRIAIQSLLQIFDNSWYRFLIKPLLLAIPSATLACYKIELFKNKIPADILSWIDDKAPYLIAGLFVVPLVASIEEYVRKKAPAFSKSLTSNGQALLLTALDSPVDKKMNHFLSVLPSVKEGTEFGEIFLAITNPDRQLAEIIRAIHIFFTGLSSSSSQEEVEFTTVLFKMANGIPVESWCYFPESERPEQNLLNDSTSLAANAARNGGRTIVIQDIEKERGKTKSQISKHCQTETGSVICYPIRNGHTKSLPLVLRITANKAFFSSDKKVMYETILRRFKKRILIEYALSELKNYGKK